MTLEVFGHNHTARAVTGGLGTRSKPCKLAKRRYEPGERG